jgi:hypothetical protein
LFVVWCCLSTHSQHNKTRRERKTRRTQDGQGQDANGESQDGQDMKRGNQAARPLVPDVVDDKGQRVPFTRRGWQSDSDDKPLQGNPGQ